MRREVQETFLDEFGSACFIDGTRHTLNVAVASLMLVRMSQRSRPESAAQPLVCVMHLTALPSWLSMSRVQRQSFVADHVEPLLRHHPGVSVRWIDVEAFVRLLGRPARRRRGPSLLEHVRGGPSRYRGLRTAAVSARATQRRNRGRLPRLRPLDISGLPVTEFPGHSRISPPRQISSGTRRTPMELGLRHWPAAESPGACSPTRSSSPPASGTHPTTIAPTSI